MTKFVSLPRPVSTYCGQHGFGTNESVEYSVVWLKSGQVIGASALKSLAEATIYAMQNFDAEQKQNPVDRVEVRNGSGALCFQHGANRPEL